LHPYAPPHSPRTRPSRYRRVKPAKWPTPGIKANRQSDTQSNTTPGHYTSLYW